MQTAVKVAEPPLGLNRSLVVAGGRTPEVAAFYIGLQRLVDVISYVKTDASTHRVVVMVTCKTGDGHFVLVCS